MKKEERKEAKGDGKTETAKKKSEGDDGHPVGTWNPWPCPMPFAPWPAMGPYPLTFPPWLMWPQGNSTASMTLWPGPTPMMSPNSAQPGFPAWTSMPSMQPVWPQVPNINTSLIQPTPMKQEDDDTIEDSN